MCSHYQTLKDAELLLKKFGVRDKTAAIGKYDMWPRYQGVFVRRPVEHDAGDEAVPEREVILGRWGLISGSTGPDGLAAADKLSTFNARDDRVANAFTFRNAWRHAQHCGIQPMRSLNLIGARGKLCPLASRGPMVDRLALPASGIGTGTRPASGKRATPCRPSMRKRIRYSATTSRRARKSAWS